MAERGRPSEYHPELTPKLAEALAKQGLVNEDIAEGLDIDVRTLYAWKQEYPDFSHALSKGKESIDEAVQNALLRRALGYTITLTKDVAVSGGKDVGAELQEAEYEVHIPGDVGAQTIWLKNRKPIEWRDKQPEGQGNDQQLRIVLDNQTNNPEYMANVEINIPTKEKAPE